MATESLVNSWSIQDVEDGILVRVLYREVDARTGLLLVDELFELTQQRDRANLYLDFGEVELLSSAVLAHLLILDRTLKETGRHLTIFSLNPFVRGLLQVSRLTNLLDVRAIPLPRPVSHA